MLPYCTPEGSLSFSPLGNGSAEHENINEIVGIIYLAHGIVFIPLSCFVLSVFCSKSLWRHSCYKIMAFVNVLDILNLLNACVFAGLFSLLEITHCTRGMWVVYVSSWQFGVWFLYCGACQVLAFNRFVQFFNRNLAESLFAGKRVYFWLIVAFAYCGVLNAAIPDPFYFYNPYEGSFYFLRASGEANVVQIYANFVKAGFTTVAYLLMIFLMFLDTKKIDSTKKISTFHLKVSLQTLVIAILADLCAGFYMAESYIALPDIFLRYAGTLAQLVWIYLHAGTALVYLIMNKTVHHRLRMLLKRKNVNVIAVSRSLP